MITNISVCKTDLRQGNEDNKVKKKQRHTTNEKPNMKFNIFNKNEQIYLRSVAFHITADVRMLC